MSDRPQPYQAAPPHRVLALMAGLAWAAGQPDGFQCYLGQLTTLLTPRVPACQGTR